MLSSKTYFIMQYAVRKSTITSWPALRSLVIRNELLVSVQLDYGST